MLVSGSESAGILTFTTKELCTMQTMQLYQLTAAQGEYSAPVGARIVELHYKQTTDKVTNKPKVVPANCVACVPQMELPSTGESGLDSILLAVMQGYQEELIRELRRNADNPNILQLTAEQTNLAAVVKFGTDKASSLKLTESNIATWWKDEGEAAVTATLQAMNSPEKDLPKLVAAFAVAFSKLAAPTPDITEQVAQVMLKRINILGNECTPICHAIRRKLNARIDAAQQAKQMADLLGANVA